MQQNSYYAILGIPDFSSHSACQRAWEEKMAGGINSVTHDELKKYVAAWYVLRDHTRKYHYDIKLQQQLDT